MANSFKSQIADKPVVAGAYHTDVGREAVLQFFFLSCLLLWL